MALEENTIFPVFLIGHQNIAVLGSLPPFFKKKKQDEVMTVFSS